VNRPLEGVRPIGPISIDVSASGKFTEFKLVPKGDEFDTSTEKVEDLLTDNNLEGEVIEEANGNYIVNINDDAEIRDLLSFIRSVKRDMSLNSVKSGLSILD